MKNETKRTEIIDRKMVGTTEHISKKVDIKYPFLQFSVPYFKCKYKVILN